MKQKYKKMIALATIAMWVAAAFGADCYTAKNNGKCAYKNTYAPGTPGTGTSNGKWDDDITCDRDYNSGQESGSKNATHVKCSGACHYEDSTGAVHAGTCTGSGNECYDFSGTCPDTAN